MNTINYQALSTLQGFFDLKQEGFVCDEEFDSFFNKFKHLSYSMEEMSFMVKGNKELSKKFFKECVFSHVDGFLDFLKKTFKERHLNYYGFNEMFNYFFEGYEQLSRNDKTKVLKYKKDEIFVDSPDHVFGYKINKIHQNLITINCLVFIGILASRENTDQAKNVFISLVKEYENLLGKNHDDVIKTILLFVGPNFNLGVVDKAFNLDLSNNIEYLPYFLEYFNNFQSQTIRRHPLLLFSYLKNNTIRNDTVLGDGTDIFAKTLENYLLGGLGNIKVPVNQKHDYDWKSLQNKIDEIGAKEKAIDIKMSVFFERKSVNNPMKTVGEVVLEHFNNLVKVKGTKEELDCLLQLNDMINNRKKSLSVKI